jgi:hypothetical protein
MAEAATETGSSTWSMGSYRAACRALAAAQPQVYVKRDCTLAGESPG